jgi:hypothetical protein
MQGSLEQDAKRNPMVATIISERIFFMILGLLYIPKIQNVSNFPYFPAKIDEETFRLYDLRQN